jgi:hypothetical protein
MFKATYKPVLKEAQACFNPCACKGLLLHGRLAVARRALGGEVVVLSPADFTLNQFPNHTGCAIKVRPMNSANFNRRDILEGNLAARNSTHLKERTLTAPK